MINNENYEGYLMRYADGELGAAEAAEVEAFLDMHPDLRDELAEIMSPELHVTPPLVTMPGKERLMHDVAAKAAQSRKKMWMGVAAAITLFVVAAGVVRAFLPQNDGGAVTADADTALITVSDTILPDSLYIRPEKREPLYLAQTTYENEKSFQHENKKDNSPLHTPQSVLRSHQDVYANSVHETTNEEITTEDNENILQRTNIPQTHPKEELLAQTGEVRPTKGARLVGGRVIVVETDRLVDVTPLRDPATTRPDVVRGYIVENSLLATEERKGFVGRTIDRIAATLSRRSQNIDTMLAFSEE